MNTMLEIYTACSALLIFNLLFLANGTALNRARSNKVINPEDTKLNKKAELSQGDDGIVARYRRAHLNALENILPWLPMAYLFMMTRPQVWLVGALFGSFTFFRWLHSIAYVKSMQPWRTISFAISVLSLAAMVVITVVRVFTA